MVVKNESMLLSIVAVFAIVAIIVMVSQYSSVGSPDKYGAYKNDLTGKAYDGVLPGEEVLPDKDPVTDQGYQTPPTESCTWSSWKNRDTPGGSGDWETRSSFPDVCNSPVAVECQTLDGRDYTKTGQVYTCTPSDGGICQNQYNNNACLDYKVRFCCSSTPINPDSCTDTDGEDYYTNGQVYGYKNGSYFKYYDECTNSTSVKEHICGSNTPFVRWFNCPGSCSNGACVQPSNQNLTIILENGETKTINHRGTQFSIHFESYENSNPQNLGIETTYLRINGDLTKLRLNEYKETGGLGLYADNLFITNIGGNSASLQLEIPYEQCNQYNNYCGGPDCGDGVLTPNEICESSLMVGYECSWIGFDSGVVRCNSQCTGLNFDDCHNYTYVPECGNDFKEGSEECDGGDLGYMNNLNATVTLGILSTYNIGGREIKVSYLGGNPPDRTAIVRIDSDTRTLRIHDVKTISGIVVRLEEVTNTTIRLLLRTDLKMCDDLGYGGGDLECTEQCMYDFSDCTNTTGNCTDSDGGLNIYVAGDTSVRYPNGGAGFSDYCDFSSGKTNILLEGYCENNLAKRINMTCPSQAPYCNKAICSTAPPTCTDSDNGHNIFVKGTVTESRMKEGPQNSDYCVYMSSRLPAMQGCTGNDCGVTENVCLSPILVQGSFNYCPNGCSDGACINTTANQTCVDSDGGFKPYVFGTVTKGGLSYSDYCLVAGGSYRYVEEYFCDSNNSAVSNYSECVFGCSEGACRTQNVTNTSGYNLSNYPRPFLDNNNMLNSIFVIGRYAATEDVISVTDIVANLQSISPAPFPTGVVKFDDEVSLGTQKNMIVVGGMCANRLTARVYGNPIDCTIMDTPGTGKIKLIKNGNYYLILLHGYSSMDTRKAAAVLARFNDFLSYSQTNSVCVTGNLNQLTVTNC